MPVTFLSQESQELALNTFNESKKRQEKIPLVPRNLNTGWPLLQVSLFTVEPTVDSSTKYSQVLGGGDCHFFFIPAYFLAQLLLKTPVKTKVQVHGQPADNKKLDLCNLSELLNGYSVHFINLGITIGSKSGYGATKLLDIQTPFKEDKTQQFCNAIEEGLEFALKPQTQITNFGPHKKSPGYTEEQIQNAIRQEFAIFAHGQIYVDLGEFLDRKVKDEEIKEFFKTIFKVDEFQNFKSSSPELQSVIQQQKQEITDEEPLKQTKINEIEQKIPEQTDAKPIKQAETKEVKQKIPEQKVQETDLTRHTYVIPPYFRNLCQQINVMREYGESLLVVDRNKGQAAIDLADQLSLMMTRFAKTEVKNEQSLTQFKKQFKLKLFSQDELMQEHRTKWKPIVANILFALTGIGLLAIGINAVVHGIDSSINNKPFTFNKALLFAKTNREQQIETIEHSVDSICLPQ